MPSLGQILVDDKVLTKAQLEEAIQTQVIFGGRLGTNLVELGFIDEQDLAKYLSKKHGVPTVDFQLLNRIKPDILKLFTKKLAGQAEAFPLKVKDKDLWVVMADPANLEALSNINFGTGKNVKPLVLPEIRVFDLLTRFYKIGRELRYINLAMMYKPRPPTEKKKPKKKAAPPPGMSEKEAREREHIRSKIDFKRSDDLLSEDEFQSIADQEYARMQDGGAAGAQTPPPPEEVPIDVGIPAASEPTPAPIPEPVVAPPPEKETPLVPRPGTQPYKKVAQALYSMLMKNGVDQYMPRASLQEFLKVFVTNQLENFVLNLNYLATWLIMEADAPVEWLEPIMDEFKVSGRKMGIIVVLPGEPMPPMPEAAAEAEVIEEVQELPSEELQPMDMPAAEEVADYETVDADESHEDMEVIELLEDDLATVEEAEAYCPEEEPEEEEPEEEEEEFVKLTLDEAKEKLLSDVRDRNDISKIFLGFSSSFFKRSLLFTVRGDTLYGWDGHGPGIKTDLVESIMLPLADSSVFQLVNMTMSFFLGPMQPGPINDQYLKSLGGETPNNIFIMPIVVNEKVVYMLYGDNGGGEFVPPNAPELQILAYQIPGALEELIKRKKAEKPVE